MSCRIFLLACILTTAAAAQPKDAGLIVERSSGRPFGDFLHDRVLAPLLLDSTFLDVHEHVTGSVAHPWHGGVNISGIPRVSLNSAAGAASGMYSTSSEMAQWYQALMDGRVLGPEAFAEMTTFVGSGNYGFGISRRVIDGRPVWLHGGDIRGYRSQMLYDITTRTVVCLLSNDNPAPVTDIALALLRILVSDPPTEIAADAVVGATAMLDLPYPHPVRTAADITFSLVAPAHVRLTIHDALGRPVAQLTDTHHPSGHHTVHLTTRPLAPGLYLLLLRTNQTSLTRTFTILP